MIEIKAKLKTRAAAYRVQVQGQLQLPFESRQKRSEERRVGKECRL